MKKLIIIALVLCVFSSVNAFELKLPEIKATNYLDFKTMDIYVGGNVGIVDYKKIVSWDIGLMTPGQGLALSTGLSLNIGESANRLGLNFNLPSPLTIGCYYAIDFNKNDNFYGINASLLFGGYKPKYGTGMGDSWTP